jgi:ferredoxin
MERKKSRRLSGSRHFRQRLVLATLSFTDVTIDEIRSGDAAPGLRPHEVSLLRLLDKISDGTKIEINETGTDFPPSRELRFCAVRPRPPARPPAYLWVLTRGARCLRLCGACVRVCRNEGEVPTGEGARGEGPRARLRGAPRDRLLPRAAHTARPLREGALIDSAQR